MFGSWVRVEQTDDSDIDVLVKFDGPIGLLDVVDLQQQLSARALAW